MQIELVVRRLLLTSLFFVSLHPVVSVGEPMCPPQYSGGLSAPCTGGGYGVVVNATAGCAWTAVASQSWISLNASSGTGPGFIIYHIGVNEGADRTGTITGPGPSFNVAISQAGGCTTTTTTTTTTVTTSSTTTSSTSTTTTSTTETTTTTESTTTTETTTTTTTTTTTLPDCLTWCQTDSQVQCNAHDYGNGNRFSTCFSVEAWQRRQALGGDAAPACVRQAALGILNGCVGDCYRAWINAFDLGNASAISLRDAAYTTRWNSLKRGENNCNN